MESNVVEKSYGSDAGRRSSSLFHLLLYAICTGTLSAIVGLFVTYVRRTSWSPPAVWLTATGVLVVVSGVTAAPLVALLNRRYERRLRMRRERSSSPTPSDTD